MSKLEDIQIEIMQSLDHGPDFLSDQLFAGSRARVLTGMNVHANTISHARLVALEDSFPRTRISMGHARFNEYSRMYLEEPGPAARPLMQIGADFADFLGRRGQTSTWSDLARFEYCWLESYHAAEASALRLSDLWGIAPDMLMEITVQTHPAASIGQFNEKVRQLLGQEVAGLADAHAVLLTRPDAEVLVSPASADIAAIFPKNRTHVTLGNLLAGINEPEGNEKCVPPDGLTALVVLLEAGALTRVQI